METRIQVLIPQWTMLRLIVAYAGQTSSIGWWSPGQVPTDFVFHPTQRGFVGRLFPRSSRAATLNSVCDSLRVFHDARIGSRNAFHLFRLPHEWEHKIHELILRDPDFWRQPLVAELLESSVQQATLSATLLVLKNNAGVRHPVSSGPVKMGNVDQLMGSQAPAQLAALYSNANEHQILTMPYYTREAKASGGGSRS